MTGASFQATLSCHNLTSRAKWFWQSLLEALPKPPETLGKEARSGVLAEPLSSHSHLNAPRIHQLEQETSSAAFVVRHSARVTPQAPHLHRRRCLSGLPRCVRPPD